MFPPHGLATGKLVAAIGFGMAFWASGVVIIRLAAPFGLFADPGGIAMFVAGVPAAWLTVWLMQRLGRFSAAEIVPAVAAGSVAALLADGVALSWAGWLYGGQALDAATAWLLWVAALTLGAGFVAARRG